MRVLALALIAIFPFDAFGETRAMDKATRDGLVGVWEAIVQDQSMATGVYQMIIPEEGDALLLKLFSLGEDKSYSHFFGRASSIKLADGNVTIRFAVEPGHIEYADWVEIQGYAVAEGAAGAITGKLIKHRKNGPLREWSEPIAFKKGRWIRDLQRISDEGNRILSDPKIEDGHAVAREKGP